MAVFEGRILFMTAKAVRFQGVYWGGALFLPMSQITITPDEDSVVVWVKDWLCDKRGLREFTEYDEEQVKVMDES